MKKVLILIMTILFSLSLSSCTFNDDISSSSSSGESSTDNTNTKQVRMRTSSEAYDLAREYLPTAILNSVFFSDGTNYEVTNYEFFESDVNKDPDYYDLKFYGYVYYMDNYGKEKKKKKKFQAHVHVPFDSDKGITYSSCNPA